MSVAILVGLFLVALRMKILGFIDILDRDDLVSVIGFFVLTTIFFSTLGVAITRMLYIRHSERLQH